MCVCVRASVPIFTHTLSSCRLQSWAMRKKEPHKHSSLSTVKFTYFISLSAIHAYRRREGWGGRRGAAAVALAGCVFPPCLRTHATCREADALGGPDSVRPTESVTATMERQHTQITTVRSVQALMGQGGGGGRESGCLSRNPLWPQHDHGSVQFGTDGRGWGRLRSCLCDIILIFFSWRFGV